ncbi:hypothetical protein GCM10027199_38720 [Amycolatopsis magusensis]
MRVTHKAKAKPYMIADLRPAEDSRKPWKKDELVKYTNTTEAMYQPLSRRRAERSTRGAEESAIGEVDGAGDPIAALRGEHLGDSVLTR